MMIKSIVYLMLRMKMTLKKTMMYVRNSFLIWKWKLYTLEIAQFLLVSCSYLYKKNIVNSIFQTIIINFYLNYINFYLIKFLYFSLFYFKGMRCVAHTLQLTVFDTLKDSNITNILSKVRALVRKLRNQTYIYIY